MESDTQGNDLEQYVDNLCPILLIGSLALLVAVVGLSFCFWLDAPKAFCIYLGLSICIVQVICSVFYVVRAWKKYGNEGHDSSNQISDASDKVSSIV